MSSTRRTFLRVASAASLGAAVAAAHPAVATASEHGLNRAFERLRRLLDGRLVLPGAPDYLRLEHANTKEFDHIRPRALLLAATAADVQRGVLFAQDHTLPLSVRSGGHHLRGWSTGTGLVLDLSGLHPETAVTDPHTVHMGPANTSAHTLEKLAPHGLAMPTGLCATVCPGGFLLGGGMGLLTPYAGLAADRLVSAEVVLADGRVVTASEHEHPDLLWALRGGGGGDFGVVTRLTVDPVPLSQVVNYLVAWPYDAADRVVAAWQHWQADRPDALGSSVVLLRADEAPNAVPFVVVNGVWAGPPAPLERHLAELLDLVPVRPLVNAAVPQSYREAMSTWWALAATMPPRPAAEDLLRSFTHASDPIKGRVPRSALRVARGRYFDGPMPLTGIDRLLNAFDADRRPGQSRVASTMRVAGRAGQVPRTSTAYVHRTATIHLDFGAQQRVSADIAADAAAGRAWADNAVCAIAPFSNGEAYVNFPEPEDSDWAHAYWAENLARLREIKRRYDPHRVFRQPQSVVGP
ncbi:FAD-binding protein [Streptomyces sp. NPDC049555]|uniref:FAD-binding oxidoreductase n=1 Tax=unclassified Streptomyces TaxID=2593676 RepID=UPI0034303E25